MGSRMPTKTRSPSRISRAATATISSWRVQSLIAVVGRLREQVAPHPDRLQVEETPVAAAVGHVEHPPPQPAAEPFRVTRAGRVFPVGGGIPPPEARERRRMAAGRLVDD